MTMDIEIEHGLQRHYPKFVFEGFWTPGVCDLRVYSHPGSISSGHQTTRVLFVCTQLPDYHGTSITNGVEVIREAAIRRLVEEGAVKARAKRSLASLLRSRSWMAEQERRACVSYLRSHSNWIEHYPQGAGLSEEATYAMVHFSAVGEPVWSYLTRQALEKKFPGTLPAMEA